MKNIAEVIGSDRYLATLNRGVIAAGLTEELSNAGPFTVFGPSDMAFGQLDSGVFADLEKPENMVKMADLLNHHVVSGKSSFKELKDGQKLRTVNGKELDVKVSEGIVRVNGARVQARDMEASNGVVHSLDKVIILL